MPPSDLSYKSNCATIADMALIVQSFLLPIADVASIHCAFFSCLPLFLVGRATAGRGAGRGAAGRGSRAAAGGKKPVAKGGAAKKAKTGAASKSKAVTPPAPPPVDPAVLKRREDAAILLQYVYRVHLKVNDSDLLARCSYGRTDWFWF